MSASDLRRGIRDQSNLPVARPEWHPRRAVACAGPSALWPPWHVGHAGSFEFCICLGGTCPWPRRSDVVFVMCRQAAVLAGQRRRTSTVACDAKGDVSSMCVSVSVLCRGAQLLEDGGFCKKLRRLSSTYARRARTQKTHHDSTGDSS